MKDGYVPPATVERLNGHYAPGERHAAMIKIAMPLIGNGFCAESVFVELRSKFDSEKTDKEIRDVIDWCQNHNPTPSGYGQRGGKNGHSRPFHKKPVSALRLTPLEAANRLLAGFSKTEEEWSEASPVRLGDFEEDAILLFESLYEESEFINIVRLFGTDGDRVFPHGGGAIKTRAQWIEFFKNSGTPTGEAGAWVRPCPCGKIGSGKDGAPTDHDVTRFAFLLLESDSLPLAVQLSVFAKLELPIAALIDSGGKSYHAWLKIDAENEADHREKAAKLYAAMTPLGFDAANKNPSRLSRLPGAIRMLGARDAAGTKQRLVYLNPNPTWRGQEALDQDAEPLMPGIVLGNELRDRVQIYMRPKPKPFTLPIFVTDHEEGMYFRPSELTLWSGVSGHGKSTMLATVKLHLLAAGIPLFICSLEYVPERLCEMIAGIFQGGNPTAVEVDKFLRVTGDKFSVLDVTGSVEPDELLACMRSAHRKLGTQHFFIDSLMRVSGLEEDYPAQTEFVNALQAVAKETGGHIHLVAHPRKIDENFRAKKMDVKGNSSILNNADNLVTVRRNTEKDNLRKEGVLTSDKAAQMHDAEFCVEKQRATGWEGVIRLSFDPKTRIFSKFKPPEKKWLEHPRSNMRGKE